MVSPTRTTEETLDLPLLQAGRGLIKIPVKVKGVTKTALIDTGAQPNIISAATLKDLNLKTTESPPDYKIRVADGAQVSVLGQTSFDMEIGENSYKITCDIVENLPCQILLGNDFLFSIDMRLFTGRKELWIDDTRFQFINKQKETEADGKCLRTRKKVRLEANESAVVTVEGRLPHDQLFLIEETEGAEAKGVFVTRCVNYAKNKKTFVALRNGTARPIVLPKGVVIAQAFKIEKPEKDCLLLSTSPDKSQPTDWSESELAQRTHASSTSGRKGKQGLGRSNRSREEEEKKMRRKKETEKQMKELTEKLARKSTRDVHACAGDDAAYKESRRFDLSDLDIGSQLSDQQKKELQQLLKKFESVMSKHETDTGLTHLLEHDIVTDGAPIHQRPYRLSFSERQALTRLVQEYVEAGYIRESDSPYACPVVLVKKKDGTVRFCCDWRKVNDITRKDAMPLPRIDDMIDRFAQAKFFTKIDFTSGYYQVPLKKSAIEKTAFVTPDGHYELLVMGMGLTNAPATFQRLMYKVLGDMLWKNAMAYMDDLVIFSPTYEQHMKDLSEVLSKIKTAGLKIKPPKCSFAKKGIQYLGFIISDKGVECDPATTEKVKAFRKPTCRKDVRSFLGLTSYYRKFIHRYAFIAKPLYELTKDEVLFQWTSREQEAFEELKRRLTSPPVLMYPDLNKPFIVATDASGFGVGAVLKQEDDEGKERVIAYASRVLNKAERNYSTTERECLALKFATQVFRPYLYGTRFTVITDHQSLVYLKSMKNPNGRLARWKLHLLDFDFTVKYKKGKLNTDADTMSRYQMEKDVPDPETNSEDEREEERMRAERRSRPKAQKTHDQTMVDTFFEMKAEAERKRKLKEADEKQKAEEEIKKKKNPQPNARSQVGRNSDCESTSSGIQKKKNQKNNDVIKLKKSDDEHKEAFKKKKPPHKEEESRVTIPMRLYNSKQTTGVYAIDSGTNSESEASDPRDSDSDRESDEPVSEDIDSDEHVESHATTESVSRVHKRPAWKSLGRKTTIEVVPRDDPYSPQQRKDGSGKHAAPKDTARAQKRKDDRKDDEESDDENDFNDEESGDQAATGSAPTTSKTRNPAEQLIVSEQRKDQGWNRIIEFLENVSSQADADRRVMNAAKHYVIRDKILYRRIDHPTGRRLAIVVPDRLKPVICSNAHEKPTSGHLAARRTYYRMKGNYFWTGMWKDVKQYVEECDKCQQMKDRTQRMKGKLHPIPAETDPFVVVACDKIGPIQNGTKKYIFIAVDLATRTMIAKATLDGTAATAAKFFEKNVILAHRAPAKVITDNGSEFKAEFEKLMEKHHVKHIHSSPRHPRSNGMVERANKTLSQMIRTAVNEKRHTDWEQHVAPSVYAYNTSVHEVTGYTPYYLLRGVHPPSGNLLNEPNDLHPKSENATETLLESRQKAVERTQKYQQKQKERYDKKRGHNSLKKGDYVMMEICTQKKGQSQRFNERKRGPFQVVKVYDNNTVDITGMGKEVARVNIERLSVVKMRQQPEEQDIIESETDSREGEDESQKSENLSENLTQRLTIGQAEDTASHAGDNESPEDEAIQRLVPIRRSTRIKKPTNRLIETLFAQYEEWNEARALLSVKNLFQ